LPSAAMPTASVTKGGLTENLPIPVAPEIAGQPVSDDHRATGTTTVPMSGGESARSERMWRHTEGEIPASIHPTPAIPTLTTATRPASRVVQNQTIPVPFNFAQHSMQPMDAAARMSGAKEVRSSPRPEDPPLPAAGPAVLSAPQANLPNVPPQDAILRVSDPGSPPATISRDQAIHVAEQLARVVHSQPTGTTDITLNPKELGHVRLSMQTVDGTMIVAITAERTETADLMRRHIDALGQEFRALGFQDVTFSFSGRQSGHGNPGPAPDPNFGSGQNPERGQHPHDRPDTTGDSPADRFIPRRIAAQTGGTGLDLRL
jgi:hypothetical protein